MQMRARIAQEAARLMAEQGITDFYVAKRKAARHLGAPDTRNMPRNAEVEEALASYHRLFHASEQAEHLAELRTSATQAMRFLEDFSPRLVGSVLSGTAGPHSDINLHLFADTAEQVAMFLMEQNIPYDSKLKRFRLGGDETQEFPVFGFRAGEHPVELTVFPSEGRREAPRSPVDGKPMRRASLTDVEFLLNEAK
ncbi:hypothetical protein DFR30_0240 [Thiogranum longum]|uniref:Nucleotidyltransferase-like protein n=1 Tax=Thiogranum longum TaxID=1537524 RepID=A0A4R1HA64_9GAMM|nr:hypothetical protein [Thiogranum longum]TCK17020.1 hypothetical protein DFR30_0240 [Thiogranum longum]